MKLSHYPLRLLAILAIGAAAVGCSGDDSSGGASPGTDIDPRSYFEDYENEVDDVRGNYEMGDGTASTADEASDVAADADDVDASIEPPGSPEPPEPGFLDDNTFTDPGASPFVATAEDPLSTFGFDVDTASLSVGRTFLDEGYLPEPDSVRTEEWINAFDYGYPEPDTADELAVLVDGAPSPFEDDTHLVRVGAQAGNVPPEERPDAAITLVVDTSGSMDIRERLGLVRSTLALFAVHLRPTDTVAVVTFESEAQTLLPPTPVAEVDTIVAAIEDLGPGGSTNLEGGLRQGYELAEEAFREDAINTVILASDGVANQGVTDLEELTELVSGQADEGIRLVTAGYGMGNYRDDLMEQLANRGDGFYTYIDTYEEAERVFSTELTTTLTVVAAEARAQVDFDPEAVEEYRLVGYDNRIIADESFRDDSEDTGELGSGHTVTALYEVRLPDEGPSELGEVSVRHQPADVGGTLGDAVEQTTPITLDDMAPSFDEAPSNLRLAGAVATFAELMGEHPVAADRDVTLDELAQLADAIDSDGAEGDGDDVGPEDLVELIDLAQAAAPSVTGYED